MKCKQWTKGQENSKYRWKELFSVRGNCHYCLRETSQEVIIPSGRQAKLLSLFPDVDKLNICLQGTSQRVAVILSGIQAQELLLFLVRNKPRSYHYFQPEGDKQISCKYSKMRTSHCVINSHRGCGAT